MNSLMLSDIVTLCEAHPTSMGVLFAVVVMVLFVAVMLFIDRD